MPAATKDRLIATRDLRRAWRMYLAKHELSQRAAAANLGYSDSTLSLRITGRRTIDADDVVAGRLCSILGIAKSKAFREVKA